MAPRPRKNKKVAAGMTSQQGPTTTPTARQSEDACGASITFVVPLSSERPTPSIVPVIPSVIPSHASEVQAVAPGWSALFFTSYPVPENQSDPAAEIIRQANMMMERMKTVHEHSQAANHASAALRANVQVSRLFDCPCSIRICYLKIFLLYNLLLFVSNLYIHWVFCCLWYLRSSTQSG